MRPVGHGLDKFNLHSAFCHHFSEHPNTEFVTKRTRLVWTRAIVFLLCHNIKCKSHITGLLHLKGCLHVYINKSWLLSLLLGEWGLRYTCWGQTGTSDLRASWTGHWMMLLLLSLRWVHLWVWGCCFPRCHSKADNAYKSPYLLRDQLRTGHTS